MYSTLNRLIFKDLPTLRWHRPDYQQPPNAKTYMNAVTWYLTGDGHIQAQVNVLCSDVGECGNAIALDVFRPTLSTISVGGHSRKIERKTAFAPGSLECRRELSEGKRMTSPQRELPASVSGMTTKRVMKRSCRSGMVRIKIEQVVCLGICGLVDLRQYPHSVELYIVSSELGRLI